MENFADVTLSLAEENATNEVVLYGMKEDNWVTLAVTERKMQKSLLKIFSDFQDGTPKLSTIVITHPPKSKVRISSYMRIGSKK